MPTLTKLLILAFFATLARSEILQINNIQLDGFQPATPTLSPATGIATMIINTDTRFVEISGTFEGLLAPASMAHLHGPADFAEPSPLIILPLTISADTSGTFSAGRVVSESIYSTILSSLSYINIHTPAHPTGEIRGQVVVPSPATAGLLMLLPALVTRRSRR